eukprot:1150629-Alexandrium_andersonii.AAC.1
MWHNQRAELRTCGTLLAALKQWLEDERVNQLGDLEQAREDARSKERLGGFDALRSLFPPNSLPPVGATPTTGTPNVQPLPSGVHEY